jgi:hypothetical protein
LLIQSQGQRITPTFERRAGALAVWLFACVAGVVGFGVRTVAQAGVTGAIRGTVLDDQRSAVRSATVILESSALQGRLTAIPRDDGSYGFLQLPPGNYEIAFEAPGFLPVKRRTTVLSGAAVELHVTLRDEATRGRPDDVSETPAPIAAPTLAAHFEHDEIDALATPRTLSGIAQLAPGLTTNTPNAGQLSIHGAVAFDSVFLVNGIDVSDNLFGSPQNLFVEDAIEETAVLTSGLSADRGRFTGGVISAITKSGGNRYSGTYRANLSNPTWTTQTPFELCDAAVTLAGCRKANPRPDELQAAHEGTLGGFVIKDRVWFFTAGRLAKASNTTPLAVSGATNTETTSNQRGQVKITSSLAPGQTITFDALSNLTTNTGHPSFAYTADPSAVGKQTSPNYYYLASYRGAVGKKAYVDVQFSHRAFERRALGANSRTIADSPILTQTVLADGFPAHYNAPYFDVADPEKRNNFQGSGSVTYSLTTSNAGRHDVAGGYEFFRSQHTGGGSQSATGYVYDTNYLTEPSGAPTLDASGRFIPLWVPGTTLIENWLAARGANLNVDTQSVYLHDRWTINARWSADLGVRQERSSAASSSAFGGINANTVMPRLAASYNIDGHGAQVVHATYGHYAGRYPEIPIGRSTGLGNPDLWLGVYVGPVGQGRSFAPGFDPSNYLTVAGRFPTANVSVDDRLSPPLVKEFTTSYGAALLNGRGFVQTAFVWRRWSDFIEDDISLANGTTHVIRNGFDVGTVTNVLYRNRGDAVRRYQAVEFQGRFRASSNWTLNGTYTLQLQNDGNEAGEAVDQPGATGPLGDYPEVFTSDRQYPNGRLPSFQRHRLRAWSIYRVEMGRAGALSLSALVRAESGRAFSLVAIDQPLTEIQTARLVAAGYPDRPASQAVFFGTRGSQQFAGYGVTDLALVYSLPLFKSARPWVKLEIYNALNNQKLIAWDTTVVPDGASAVDALGLRTGFRAAQSFGKATSNNDFPAPFEGETGGRTFRIAAGFRF